MGNSKSLLTVSTQLFYKNLIFKPAIANSQSLIVGASLRKTTNWWSQAQNACSSVTILSLTGYRFISYRAINLSWVELSWGSASKVFAQLFYNKQPKTTNTLRCMRKCFVFYFLVIEHLTVKLSYKPCLTTTNAHVKWSSENKFLFCSFFLMPNCAFTQENCCLKCWLSSKSNFAWFSCASRHQHLCVI